MSGLSRAILGYKLYCFSTSSYLDFDKKYYIGGEENGKGKSYTFFFLNTSIC